MEPIVSHSASTAAPCFRLWPCCRPCLDRSCRLLHGRRRQRRAAVFRSLPVVTLPSQKLRQALYYLDNTTLKAPEDGRIINLQVRPGMVPGIYRIGGIAALIAEADRYLLATLNQESLKYVRPGKPVEVALDLYPGQIFAAKVDSIWRGNGEGQYLPSDEIPKFQQPRRRLFGVSIKVSGCLRLDAMSVIGITDTKADNRRDRDGPKSDIQRNASIDARASVLALILTEPSGSVRPEFL